MNTDQTFRPQVSIGLPVYNGEKYLRKALDSILSQTYDKFELIISDNCSTDGTSEICREYGARDSRIRYVRQYSNRGAAANFRFVLESAQHERFIWAAADDWWDRDRLEKLVTALAPETAAVVGAISRWQEVKNIAHFIPKEYPKHGYLSFIMREEARCEKVYFIYGLMWRKAAIQAFPSSMDLYASDAIFCYRLLELGGLRSIQGATLHALAHSESEGSSAASAYHYSLLRFLFLAHPLNYYFRYLESTPIPYKPLVLAALPFKAIKSQAHLWYRAYCRLALKSPFVHGKR